jgi:tetratricopeptide (TPR) repeat protein
VSGVQQLLNGLDAMRTRMNHATVSSIRCLTSAAIVGAVLAAGCAEQPKKDAAATAAPPPPAAAPAAAARPAEPELSPAQAKAQSQKLALEAVDQLQNGDEIAARQTLAKALALDPANDIAKKMNDQIAADAQKELGPTFFRYTVARDDSLSKLAQQYLGDRFRFYILAKYNDIANPSRLGAGQVIKIPGRAPPPGAAPPRAGTPDATDAAKAAPPDAAPAPDELALLMQKGRQQQAAGNLEGAYATSVEAAARFPGNKDAVLQRDASKSALIRSYDREGTQAFQRQNLDLAITKWDRILELDPGNQKAKLERERSLDLKQRMNEKFGTPK